MSSSNTSGIQTSASGESYIPASKRADGTLRKEIKVRPGYRPPEDVEKYKSRTAETWRTRGSGGIPGADLPSPDQNETESKSKNARRREAAKRKKELEAAQPAESESIEADVANLQMDDGISMDNSATNGVGDTADAHADPERQKKIRNYLKKLRAVRDLKAKKAAGEKLSADQLVKIAKEQEILRDLAKFGYQGPEVEENTEQPPELHPD